MKNNETGMKEYKFYKNPVAQNGDFADPFILKYNGRYYLYCTNPDVKCWSSRDLLEWKYEGTAVAPGQLAGLVPFAPEVVYWNGYFYMYTSPSGLGHYILKSENPTGPFTLQTGNIGLTIDGSVFIDDDGKWYFYRADDTGIKGYAMKDPLSIGVKTDINAFMDGWTEGPFVVKRNGKYYMTYTGNHFLSAGYRINYSVSGEGPLSGFEPYSKNPLLINTEGKGVGLGHSMSFLGPDLDTWYMAYHNLNLDATRDLNIDKLAWNGDGMTVYGPTVSKQTAPEPPDFSDDFAGNELGDSWVVKSGSGQLENGFLRINAGNGKNGMVLSKKQNAKAYTAEFNMKLLEAPAASGCRLGGVVSCKDEKNYGLVLLNPMRNTVETQIVVNGRIKESNTASLPDGYDYGKLHSVRVVKAGDKLKAYVDGMLKLTVSANGLDGGEIGFYSEAPACFGYTAISGKTNGESIFNAFKPIPGDIEAVHFNGGGKNVGYCLKSERGDSEVRSDGFYTEQCSEGGFNTALREKGEWLAYNINVAEAAAYNVDLRVAGVESGTGINLWLDGVSVMESAGLEATEDGRWRTQSIKGLELPEGLHELRVGLAEGSLKLYTMGFYKAGNKIPGFKDAFENGIENWAYASGVGLESIQKDGTLLLGPYGKLAAGEDGWTDYSVEVDVKGASGLASGIVFRAANPAEGGEGTDCKTGSNYYQGYFAGLTRDGIILLKQNYDRKELARAGGSFEPGRSYHLKVDVKGDIIQVYVDDMEKAKIEYTDRDPFTHGKAGIRTEGETAFFDNFVVTAG